MFIAHWSHQNKQKEERQREEREKERERVISKVGGKWIFAIEIYDITILLLANDTYINWQFYWSNHLYYWKRNILIILDIAMLYIILHGRDSREAQNTYHPVSSQNFLYCIMQLMSYLYFRCQLLYIKLFSNAIYIINQLPKVKLEM